VPIVFYETRKLAEEWTYGYLAATHEWASTERAFTERINGLNTTGQAPEPSTSEVRAWARDAGLHVTDCGRLRPEIWQAWRNANQS